MALTALFLSSCPTSTPWVPPVQLGILPAPADLGHLLSSLLSVSLSALFQLTSPSAHAPCPLGHVRSSEPSPPCLCFAHSSLALHGKARLPLTSDAVFEWDGCRPLGHPQFHPNGIQRAGLRAQVCTTVGLSAGHGAGLPLPIYVSEESRVAGMATMVPTGGKEEAGGHSAVEGPWRLGLVSQ